MTHRRLIAVLAVLAVAFIAAVALQATRERPLDPLGASPPAEVVSRTVRLAGIESAVPTLEGGVARVSLLVPQIASAADAEIAYQTGFAALAIAWPRAESYVVRLSSADTVLAELTAPGAGVRAAVEADDPRELLAVMDSRLVAGALTPEEARSSFDADVPADGAYLDAKNRAAGLLGAGGPESARAARLANLAEAMRLAAPGVAAPGRDESVLDTYAARIDSALGARDLDGAAELRAWVAALDPSAARADVAAVRVYASVCEALAASAPLGSLLADTAALAGDVTGAALETGPLTDAVLAAAGDPEAPAVVREVAYFPRAPECDASATSSGRLPMRLLARHGAGAVTAAYGTLAEDGAEGSSAGDGRAPDNWPAHRRVDGTLFWLAGDGSPLALTDHSLRGWAFSANRAAFVDAAECARVLAVYPVD